MAEERTARPRVRMQQDTELGSQPTEDRPPAAPPESGAGPTPETQVASSSNQQELPDGVASQAREDQQPTTETAQVQFVDAEKNAPALDLIQQINQLSEDDRRALRAALGVPDAQAELRARNPVDVGTPAPDPVREASIHPAWEERTRETKLADVTGLFPDLEEDDILAYRVRAPRNVDGEFYEDRAVVVVVDKAGKKHASRMSR